MTNRLNEAIPLLDALAMIYLNDTVFCFAAGVPFIMIVSKYSDAPALMNYVKKFISLLLSSHPGLSSTATAESQRAKKRKPLPLPPSRQRKSAQDGTKPTSKKAMDLKLKKIAIIEMCKKLAGFEGKFSTNIQTPVHSISFYILSHLELSEIIQTL